MAFHLKYIHNEVPRIKLIKSMIYSITLTDNRMEYTFNLLAKHLQPKDKIHKFDQVCNEQKIKHKTTKFRSP